MYNKDLAKLNKLSLVMVCFWLLSQLPQTITLALILAQTISCFHLLSISLTLNAQIFRTNIISAAFSSYMYVVKAAETKFVRKMLMKLSPGKVMTNLNYHEGSNFV